MGVLKAVEASKKGSRDRLLRWVAGAAETSRNSLSQEGAHDQMHPDAANGTPVSWSEHAASSPTRRSHNLLDHATSGVPLMVRIRGSAPGRISLSGDGGAVMDGEYVCMQQHFATCEVNMAQVILVRRCPSVDTCGSTTLITILVLCP